MRLLIKELEPDEGRILVAGRDLAELTAQADPVLPPQPRRRLPGLQAAAEPHRARQRRLRAAGDRRSSRKEIRAKVPDILRLTGLSTKLHNYPDQLSGGEQQRVSIARAFVNHPPLLLADEPTGNLDPETSIGIMQLLYRINRTGTTVLVATHDSTMVDRMRRRVIELDEGRIVRDEIGGRYAQTDMSTARVRRAAARAGAGAPPRRARRRLRRLRRRVPRLHEDRLLPPRGAALARPQRRPELRRAGLGARHAARARRVHPDRAGDDRRRQRGPRPRARRTSTSRPTPTPADVAARQARCSTTTPHVDEGRVRLQGAGAARGEGQRNPEAYQLLGSNPLPDTFRVTPKDPDRRRR